jgi:hypothetical protein
MAHPTEAEAQQEYDRIWSQLGTRAIEELIDLSAMTDRESLATLDVLTKLLIPALFTAAERAGRKRGSAGWLYAQPGVQERIAELKRIAKAANNRETAEQAIKVSRMRTTLARVPTPTSVPAKFLPNLVLCLLGMAAKIHRSRKSHFANFADSQR